MQFLAENPLKMRKQFLVANKLPYIFTERCKKYTLLAYRHGHCIKFDTPLLCLKRDRSKRLKIFKRLKICGLNRFFKEKNLPAH